MLTDVTAVTCHITAKGGATGGPRAKTNPPDHPVQKVFGPKKTKTFLNLSCDSNGSDQFYHICVKH